MRVSTQELHTEVVIRRVGIGNTPFIWEIRDGNAIAHVSPNRFRTMEAAYSAGQARLCEILASKRAHRKTHQAIIGNSDWLHDDDEPDDIDLDAYDVPSLDLQNSHEPIGSAEPSRLAGT